MKYKELKQRLKAIGLDLRTYRGVMFPYAITFADGIQKGNTLSCCRDLENVEKILKQNE